MQLKEKNRNGRLKILVAQIPMPQNRFLCDLNGAIEHGCDLHHSSADFWEMRGVFDVVHLHFPEHLTYEIEAAYFSDLGIENGTGLDDALMGELEKRLRWWSARACLVVTRHVLLPHGAVERPRWEKLYEMFYRYADGVAHFANASIAEFRGRYVETEFARGEPIHAIIPHHNYASLPNQITRDEARRKLKIPTKAKVLLVFGAIRNDAERELIENTYRNLELQNKFLLVSSWRENLAQVSWIRLKYWLRDLTRLYHRLHPRHHFHYGFVEEADTQLYLNAADVLFIPRFHVLNSGNVTLGMTFGRVVVGPDSWDVGELLRETGNPVFDPDRPETAINAMEEGFRLAEEGRIPAANRERALAEWTPEKCAEKYVALYERCGR